MAKTVTSKISAIIKRNGETALFDSKKIFRAIEGANKDCDNVMSKGQISDLVLKVVDEAVNVSPLNVEHVQDIVERKLQEGKFYDVAKSYIRYRQVHEMRREANEKLMDSYNDLLFADSKDVDLKRDNANINTDAPMGIMLKLGTEGAKNFVDHYALDEEAYAADHENWIHIHDKDFSLITANCVYIDLLKLFKGGFSTGHGFLREPNSIRAAASLACIAIQADQNDMFKPKRFN